MKLFLVSSAVILLTILEKAQCFSPNDKSASIGVPMYLVSSVLARKDTVLLSHDCAAWDAMHEIPSAVLESMTSTNLALVLIWIHVLCSRTNKKNKNIEGGGSGENAKNAGDDNSAARPARPRTTEETDIKDRRRRMIHARGPRRKKNKFVPTLERIQEGLDEDGSD